jgi:uncharacterized protein with PQ loop repeat
MIESIASIAVASALALDTASYWRQIKKTIRTKKSSQVSSTSFLYKIAKALCALVGLSIYRNFVGVGMEIFMLVVYAVSLCVIIHFKPKGWSLWK